MKSFKYIDSEYFINKSLAEGKRVLAEGAQGSLLDIDFGSYPYVTSSNTICAGVCAGLGIAPSKIGKVYGVFKAYCTRVGNGPFPTELEDETGQIMRDEGHEYGSTTGRPRRCGWLDLTALNYAIMLSGVTDLIMTKGDVLSRFDKLNISTKYLNEGQEINHIPFDCHHLNPVYEEVEGWKCQINHLLEFDQLPSALKDYLMFVETRTGTPITIISVGPDRKQTIIRS